MKIARAFTVVAAFTLISNILGYVRDSALAAKFGATAGTDAFFAAFFVPNTLYLILVAGSLSAVFLPVFGDYYRKMPAEAWLAANSVFNVVTLGLGLVALACILTRQWWMHLLFPGFDTDTAQLALDLSAILLPMLLFIGLSSLVTAVLNSFEEFTIPVIAPVISNLVVIAAILFSSYLGGIRGVAVGVVVGMLAQVFVQLPSLRRLGARYRLAVNLGDPAIRRLGMLALPMAGYLAVAYSSVAIERMIASTLPAGTITALNYAWRLFALPTLFITGSLGTVIYPRLSLYASSGDSPAFVATVVRALRVTALILTPVSLWVVVNSRVAVELLYGYGRFSPSDVQLTATIVGGYALGLMPTGIAGMVQRGFYATQDTVTPLIIEVVNLSVYALIALGLTRMFGPGGLAFARALSFVLVATLYCLTFSKRHFLVSSIGSHGMFRFLGRYSFACMVPTVVWSLPLWIHPGSYSLALDNARDLALVGACAVCGLAAYLALVLGLKLDHGHLIKNSWLVFAGTIANRGCRLRV